MFCIIAFYPFPFGNLDCSTFGLPFGAKVYARCILLIQYGSVFIY